MNKKTFFLILCGLGLILWAVGFFFGFNYTQSGALMVSIPVSLFVLVLMGGMIYLMKRFCDPRGADNYRVAKNTEKAALVIYIIVSLCTAVYIGHFVSVSMNDKTAIQDQVTKELQELDRIFDDSDTPVSGSYMSWVLDECENYKIKLQGDGMDSTTIVVKVAELEDELVEKSGFSSLRDNVRRFLGECNYSVKNWVWLTVSEKISLLEANKSIWEESVEECALKSDYAKNEPYKCNSTENYSDTVSPLTKISGSDFSISALVLIIVLQIMILLTYLSDRPNTGRDPIRYKNNDFVRSYGAKKKSGASSSSANRHKDVGNDQNNPDFVINLDDDE